MTAVEAFDPRNGHVLHELGLGLDRVGDELHGTAEVTPELLAPGTSHVRASVLATWADQSAGLLVVEALTPRVPVTMQLDVHMPRPRETTRIDLVTRVVKAGRSVVVVRMDFTDDAGRMLGIATGTFTPVPDPTLVMPESHLELARAMPRLPRGRLDLPFAQRVGCERTAPGVAVLPRMEDGLNSSNTVNGGLIALAIEEAVLGAAGGGTVTSLALRYLSPVRIGPAVATAELHDGIATVELRDAGDDKADRVAVFATAHVLAESDAG